MCAALPLSQSAPSHDVEDQHDSFPTDSCRAWPLHPRVPRPSPVIKARSPLTMVPRVPPFCILRCPTRRRAERLDPPLSLASNCVFVTARINLVRFPISASG